MHWDYLPATNSRTISHASTTEPKGRAASPVELPASAGGPRLGAAATISRRDDTAKADGVAVLIDSGELGSTTAAAVREGITARKDVSERLARRTGAEDEEESIPEAVGRAASAEAGSGAGEVVRAAALAIGGGVGLSRDGGDEKGGDGEELHCCGMAGAV